MLASQRVRFQKKKGEGIEEEGWLGIHPLLLLVGDNLFSEWEMAAPR